MNKLIDAKKIFNFDFDFNTHKKIINLSNN